MSGEKMAGIAGYPGANPEANQRDRDLPIPNSPPALASPPLANFSALENLSRLATMHSITYTAHPQTILPSHSNQFALYSSRITLLVPRYGDARLEPIVARCSTPPVT
jgi:hypothetical protein